jgi:hypothetical protein
MSNYLFTLAVGVQDRPERWGGISRYYFNLASSLLRLGHRVVFAVNPKIRRRKTFSSYDCRAVADHSDLQRCLASEQFTHAFIWGGRLDADRQTRLCCEANGVKVLFSELGWFPQAGTVYFDDEGTNAEVSFNRKEYPDCSAGEHREFLLRRRRFYRSKAGLGFLSSPPPFSIARPDFSKPVLVPLQDESDTNITLASPFQRMSDFVEYLATSYSSLRFVVRPHPSSPPSVTLPKYANVHYQEGSVDVYRNMQDYGMVVGLNSTLLLESAMMNMPVVAFGSGIGTGTGVFHDATIGTLSADLSKVSIDSAKAEAYLAFLIGQRQFFKDDLAKIKRVRSSYLAGLLDI